MNRFTTSSSPTRSPRRAAFRYRTAERVRPSGRRGWTRQAAALALALALIGPLAVPTPGGAALTGAQLRCQANVASGLGAYTKTVAKRLASCHRRIARGVLAPSTDCKTEASTATKLDAAADHLAHKIATGCDDTTVASLRHGGSCEDATTTEALSACLTTDGDALADALQAWVYATAVPMTEAAEACQNEVSRRLRGLVSARTKTLAKCKQAASKGRRTVGIRCSEDESTVERLAQKLARSSSKIAAACGPLELAAVAFGAPCESVADATELAACLLGVMGPATDASSETAFGDGSFCGDSHRLVDARVEALLSLMTPQEKVGQMTGTGFPPDGVWRTPALPELGIPGLGMTDGPRGVSSLAGAGNATAYPVGIARGASWDPSLEERIGEAIGVEARAIGAGVILAPVTTVIRHPRWGRCQETYGEDPLHIGKMGVGFIRGAQRHVIASTKHFALNSIEDTRFTVSVNVDERTLREIYLPHFDMVVNEGETASIMSAYNRVNGLYAAENPDLLDILKDDFGFRGFVESDWVFGTRSTVASALAGLDIEMPAGIFYGNALLSAFNVGDVDEATLDGAVRRILRTQFCFRLDSDPPVPDPTAMEAPEHIALSLEAAQKSIVLLRNEANLLPLDRSGLTRVAVVGPLADVENIGDGGSSNVTPTEITTIVEGLTDRAAGVVIDHVTDPGSVAGQTAIGTADAVVIAVGFTAADEGEALVGAGDRDTYPLHPADEQLIADVAALNPASIVVLEGGSAIGVENWFASVGAILMAWYPGMEGGGAIADIVFGDVNPSGKLPLAFAKLDGDFPPFLNAQDDVTYDYYHGYRLLDRDGKDPRYAFGFGLSYSTFVYSDLTIAETSLGPADDIRASFDVTNTSGVAGDEIAQLYVSYVGSGVDRPTIDLRGFDRIHLEPGETRTVELTIPVEDLAYYEVGTSSWEIEAISYGVHVGPNSADLPLSMTINVTP